MVRDFDTPLSPVDRSSKMKINKDTQALNDTLEKIDLIDIYRTVHSKTTEYTSCSSAHGTFSRIDDILGHKSSLGKFKKIEIISSIFSDHKTMRLDINYRKKNCKKYKHMEAKQYVNTNQEITEEIKEEIKKYLETNDNENVMTKKPLWYSRNSSKREVYRSKILPQETRKSQINNLTLHLKQLQKEEQRKTPKVSRRKELIKIRSEINEKQMKETIAKINKTKAGSLRR